jgi:hypothetical protein
VCQTCFPIKVKSSRLPYTMVVSQGSDFFGNEATHGVRVGLMLYGTAIKQCSVP